VVDEAGEALDGTLTEVAAGGQVPGGG